MAFGTGAYYDLPCADFFSVEHSFVNDTMLNIIHSMGKKVYVWTVNTDKTMDDLIGMNIDAVITDYPDDIYDGFHSLDDLAEITLRNLIPEDRILNELIPEADAEPVDPESY